jgi:HEAT repeat protein
MHTRQRSILSLGKIGGEKAFKAIRGTLEDQEEWIRYSAISALDNFKSAETKDIYWLAWEDDPSVYVRQRAYLALAERDYAGDPRPLMGWLDKPDPEVRRHTVKLAGKVCATEAAKVWLKENKESPGSGYCAYKLKYSLDDPDPKVRETAVDALAHLDDEPSRRALEENLPNMDSDLQELARAALKSMKAQ